MTEKVYIVVLNWNRWKDTVECLESLLHLDYPNVSIVVCDNHSDDLSFDKIKQWACGQLAAETKNQKLSYLLDPPISKPVPFLELTREQAESWDGAFDCRLVLIQTGANLGFAGGCNVGLRFALQDAECHYCWLLNNDTVVADDALSASIALMHRNPGVGLCGSLNRSYFDPATIQVEGGRLYNRWTGRVVKSPAGKRQDKVRRATPPMDYVVGASMLASRSFLEKVGLMEESYFLYFEELDWAFRAKGLFNIDYAPNSVIYHKEGGTIGSRGDRRLRSILSDQYLSRNRVLFTRRFVPWALPTVVMSVCMAAAHRLLFGEVMRARVMFSAMLLGLRIEKNGSSGRERLSDSS